MGTVWRIGARTQNFPSYFLVLMCVLLSFWPHNSPLALSDDSHVTRCSSLYCQSLDIFKLFPHSLRWKAARCISRMETLQQWSPSVQVKDTHNAIKNITVLKYCENSTFSIRRAGVIFSRRVTTVLFNRKRLKYLVFSV